VARAVPTHELLEEQRRALKRFGDRVKALQADITKHLAHIENQKIAASKSSRKGKRR
jgi:hypothetical protein